MSVRTRWPGRSRREPDDDQARTLARLAEAFPYLSPEAHREIARDSLDQQAKIANDVRRDRQRDDVAFCRRLTFEGFEHLHALAGAPHQVVIAPLGAPPRARPAARLFLPHHPDRPPCVARVRPSGGRRVGWPESNPGAPVAVLPVVALPHAPDGYRLRLAPALMPATAEGHDLIGGYASWLDALVRDHPALWPWQDLAW